MVVATEIIEDAETQWRAEPLRPHRGVVVILARAIQEDSQPSKGVSLHATQPSVPIVPR